ncbi:hypothetical protein CspHIS471_0205040 [Cutaneotrichosporon sp. HIS471]|nr:hypothetical protein CspHIS471_0205040 [Cutaneotrichosporon sp. HIS471]
MTSLVSIPGCVALHLPARGVAAVPMANGDLHLTLLPADPPSRKEEILTLSVGSSAFVVAKNSPVQRIQSKNEHPSFVFTPAPPEGGQSIGQVRIDMSDSSSPEAWERVEEGCRALEAELKAHNAWEDKELFVDDEYETDGPITGPKAGWGETIASSVMGGASWLVGRLTGAVAPEQTLPTSAPQAPGAHAHVPVQPHHVEEQPADFKTIAADSWTQAGIAARGISEAAVQVGGAIGQQARTAVGGMREQPAGPENVGASHVTSPTNSTAAAVLNAPSAPTGPIGEEDIAAKAEKKEDKKVPVPA